jgi:hypothetical protein
MCDSLGICSHGTQHDARQLYPSTDRTIRPLTPNTSTRAFIIAFEAVGIQLVEFLPFCWWGMIVSSVKSSI